MTRRGWITALVLAGLCAALAATLLRPGTAAVADTPFATAQAPARHCAKHAPAALRSLREGAQQLVVVVKAFQPPKARSGQLVVSLLSPNDKRIEVTRFAVHPLRAFTAQEPNRSQRFLVSLTGMAHLVEDGKPLCVEVGFDTSAGAAEGGMAEIGVELVPAPGTPSK